MSKTFKNKVCAYCGGVSSTGDHIFPRAFFPRDVWSALPIVPACRKCNGEKSKLENYLATVLLFGGRHADAVGNLNDMGARRLAKNVALHRRLARSQTTFWLRRELGLIAASTALEMDDAVFTRFFEYVAKGLTSYEFGHVLGQNDDVTVCTVSVDSGISLFQSLLEMNAATRALRNIGRGAFIYKGSQGVDNPSISVWLISVFGGLCFLDANGQLRSTLVGAITGPREVVQRALLRKKWIDGRGNIA